LRREPLPVFYARFAWQTLRSHFWMVYWLGRLELMRWMILRGQRRVPYRDLALRDEGGEPLESLALFRETRGGEAAARRREQRLARPA
jgi:hypothetical protein